MEQVPVQDLQFRFIRKLRCFEADSIKATPFGRKLVAVSSKFGFVVVVGTNNKFMSMKTSELHKLVSNDDSEFTAFPKRRFEFFLPNVEIFAIEFNCDGRVFAVAANTENGPFVYLFDGLTHSFDFNDQPYPLCCIPLSSAPTAKMTSFEWNPCIPETFIAACTDKLCCIQFKLANPTTFVVHAEKAFPQTVTCLSWSPKGKQVTVGDASGKIHQLKPELTLVRTTEAPLKPLSIGPGPFRIVGICWLETTEWLVAYASSTNNVCLLTLTIKKNQPVVWEEARGLLPPLFQSELPTSFHFWPLFDWQVVFAGSTCFTDVYAYGNVGATWKPLSMDEIYSISAPLTKTGKQTQFIGGSFDYSSILPVTIERDGSQVGPQPVIFLLTTDGILLMYHVVSLNANRPSLNIPVEDLSLDQSINGTKPTGTEVAGQTSESNKTGIATGFSTSTNIFGAGSFPASFGAASTPKLNFDGLFTKAEINSSANVDTKLEAEKKAAEELQKKADEDAKQRALDDLKRKKEEEDRKALEEAERKQAAEEAERKRVADEVARKKAAEEAERKRKEEETRKLALEEEKRKKEAEKNALVAKNKAEYHQCLEYVVRNMNDYRKIIDAFHEIRNHVEANAPQNLDFDSYMAPLNKCIESVKVIGQVISCDLHKYSMITNNLEATVEEIKDISSNPNAEGITPEWVMELSDNLDDLEQRLFEVTEKFTFCTNSLDYIGKGMKDGRTKVTVKMVLTKDQQKILSKNSEVLIEFVKKLSTRLTNLRKQLRTIAQSDAIRKTAESLNRAGGNVLEESTFLDESLNASATAANLLANDFSILKVDDNPFSDVDLGGKIIIIKKLSMFYEKNKHHGPKFVKALNLDEYLAKKKLLSDKKDDSIVVHPKVAEARRNLAEHLKDSKELKPTIATNQLEKTPKSKVVFDISKFAATSTPFTAEKNPVESVTPTTAVKTPVFALPQKSIFGSPVVTSTTTPALSSNVAASSAASSFFSAAEKPSLFSTTQTTLPGTITAAIETPKLNGPIVTSATIPALSSIESSFGSAVSKPTADKSTVGTPIVTSTTTPSLGSISVLSSFASPVATTASKPSPFSITPITTPVTTTAAEIPKASVVTSTTTPAFGSTSAASPFTAFSSATQKPSLSSTTPISTPVTTAAPSTTSAADTSIVGTPIVTSATTPSFGSTSAALPFASPLATAASKPSLFPAAQTNVPVTTTAPTTTAATETAKSPVVTSATTPAFGPPSTASPFASPLAAAAQKPSPFSITSTTASTTTTPAQKPIFGSPIVSSTTTPAFGSTSVASSFASPLAAAAAKSSPFSTTQIAAPATTDGDVGMEDDATNGLGFGGFNLGTATTTDNANKNPFGGIFSGKKEAGPFGAPQTGFGQKPANSGFGTVSAFGGNNASGTSMFGGGSTTKSMFGGGTSFGSSFGGGSSIFGQKTSTFGGGSQVVQGSNSPFGQQAATNTGFGQSSAFASKPSPFGQTTSPFSQPAGASPFSQQTSAFGQGSSNSPFAQTSGSSSAFGQQNNSAFGGGAGGFSSFANKSGGFGALAQQATQSNSFANGGGFGQNANNSGQTKNAFSSWRS
uniref:Nuclear pore complex protein n=1 Tax=Panagrolaimus sp. JU765 TaxID=591449 RepID=A0AC34Q9J0_9BILA